MAGLQFVQEEEGGVPDGLCVVDVLLMRKKEEAVAPEEEWSVIESVQCGVFDEMREEHELGGWWVDGLRVFCVESAGGGEKVEESEEGEYVLCFVRELLEERLFE